MYAEHYTSAHQQCKRKSHGAFSFKCLSLLFRSILSVLSSKKFNSFFFYNFDYEEQNPIVRPECEENSATTVNTIPKHCIQPARGVLLLRISIRQ